MGVIDRRKRGEHPNSKIVYDPIKGTLSKEIIAEGEQKNFEIVIIEGRSNPASIYLEIGEDPTKTKTLLARVDLGQLGWSEKLQRHMGYTREIWVRGRVPSSSIRERATTWPRVGKSTGLETPTLRRYPASTSDISIRRANLTVDDLRPR